MRAGSAEYLEPFPFYVQLISSSSQRAGAAGFAPSPSFFKLKSHTHARDGSSHLPRRCHGQANETAVSVATAG